MNKTLIGLLIFILLSVFIFTNKSLHAELLDYATYIFNTGDNVSVGWDAPTDEADLSLITYEVRLKDVERNFYIPVVTSTSATQVTFKLPKVGHYIVEARTIRSVPNQTPISSDWSTSVTSGKIGTVSRSWWLYGKLAKPGQITIGKIKRFVGSIYDYFAS